MSRAGLIEGRGPHAGHQKCQSQQQQGRRSQATTLLAAFAVHPGPKKLPAIMSGRVRIRTSGGHAASKTTPAHSAGYRSRPGFSATLWLDKRGRSHVQQLLTPALVRLSCTVTRCHSATKTGDRRSAYGHSPALSAAWLLELCFLSCFLLPPKEALKEANVFCPPTMPIESDMSMLLLTQLAAPHL